MNNLFPKQEGFNWPMRLSHVYAHLGLGLNQSRLPAEGIALHLIQGVPVWVEPAPAKLPNQRKSSKHRTMAACPECGFICSLGRMHQHAKIHRA